MMQRDAIERQWELLKLLPNRGVGVTAQELTDRLNTLGFNASKRTIERDLNFLSCHFGLHCNDKSKPYGWRWMENTEFDIPNLSISDCVSLSLVEDMVNPLLPKSILQSLQPRFNLAKTKLKELSQKNQIARWTDKIATRYPTMPLMAPEIDAETLENIQQAVLSEKIISVQYQGVNDHEPKTLVLHPQGIVQRGPISYLIATAFEYDDIRLYAMHRFSNCRIEADAARAIDGFLLSDYVESGAIEFGSGSSIRFKARIHQQIAYHLKETPLSSDMEISGEGEWLMLTGKIQDSWQFRWWVLSQGSWLEVLEPRSLRQAIAQDVLQTAKFYQEESL